MLLKNNKIVYLVEALFLIVILLVAGILLFSGPIPIEKISAFNSNLLLKIIKLNKDISRIKSGVNKVVYYSTLKHAQFQKTQFKKALNNLGLSLKRTDKQYKELDGFIKKNGAFLKHDRQIIVYFNKSYFKWKNINRPILKIIIKYPEYIPSKIAYKLFIKHTLYLSHLPTANIIKDAKLYFKKLFNIAIHALIAAVAIIIFLSILFLYFADKLYNTLSQSEQKFKSFFYNLLLPSFIVDVETGNFIDANNSAIKFYGYSKDELLNMSIEKINISGSPQELKVFRRTVAAKGGEVIIFKHKLKNEEIKTIHAYMVVITLNNKKCLLVVILDITEKKLLEDKLKESEELFRTLADNIPVGLDMHKDRFIYANPALQDMLGYSEDELKNMRFWDILAEEYKEEAKRAVKEGLADTRYKHYVTFKAIKKSGKELWMYIYAGSVKYKDEIVRIASFIDITEEVGLRNALEQERDLFKVLIENIHSGIALYSKDKFLYTNAALLDLFNYSKEEFLNLEVADFFNIEEDRIYNSDSSLFKIHHNNELSSKVIYKYIKGDKVLYIDLFRTVITFNNEETGLAIFSDITDQILKEQGILLEKEAFKELSEHDALTGINNRRSFDDKLAEFLNIALRYDRPLSLIMFDIDRFKDINDAYGHGTGDFILKELSAVTKKELRTTDFFARYGGEEFMVIAPETPLSTAKELAERLRLKVEKYDFKIEQSVTCSLGVTEVKAGDTSQSIIYRADAALYEAKETGRNKVSY